MWWIIGLTALALVLLTSWQADERRENLRKVVLGVVREHPGKTGDEIAVLVADAAGRNVGLAEVYDALVALRDAGLVLSEYQRLPDGFGEHKLRDGLPAVWRAVGES